MKKSFPVFGEALLYRTKILRPRKSVSVQGKTATPTSFPDDNSTSPDSVRQAKRKQQRLPAIAGHPDGPRHSGQRAGTCRFPGTILPPPEKFPAARAGFPNRNLCIQAKGYRPETIPLKKGLPVSPFALRIPASLADSLVHEKATAIIAPVRNGCHRS